VARNGPTGPVWRCPFIGVARKWLAEGRNDAIRDTGKIVRETWIAPRAEAQKRVKQLFEQFPSGTYLTEIESWRSCRGGSVEVIVKRLDIPIDEAD
jgi:hypothetical protein